MPRTAIPVTEVTNDGVADPAFTVGDATNEMTIDVDEGQVVVVINNQDGAAAHDTTFVTPGTVEGAAIADKTVSTPANGTMVWHGSAELFTQRSGADRGKVQVNVTSAQLRYKAYRLR